MLAAQVRSGLEETVHDGAVAVVAPDGSLIASSGDIDRPFYLRSSAKPFQAVVSQEAGAALKPLELAMACASHRGFPVQVALVESMLAEVGLTDGALRCPVDWPLSEIATHRLAHAGATTKRRIWHNCSGKHAGFIRACVANGWPVESYLDPGHPLQARVVSLVTELGDCPVEPVGVDGCGVPVLRTTTRVMGLLFARLATATRLAEVFGVMRRYPGLIGVNGAGDTEIAVAVGAAAKGGAAGCIGVALDGRLGVAVKSWDGLGAIAALGAVDALDQVGVLGATARETLQPIARPPVYGGEAVVGHFEPRFELT